MFQLSTLIVLELSISTGLFVRLHGVSAADSDGSDKHTQTPENVIGLVDGTVTLECPRKVPPGEITWKYIRPGSNEESDIPSVTRYRFDSSNYGTHRLILEQLQLADAGVYVCRSTQDKFDGAGAYVVVVAYGPFCFSNLTSSVHELAEGDAVKLTCVVTYASIPGVNPSLTWTQTDGNFTVSKNYTASATGASFHSLSIVERAKRPSLSQYICKVTFHHTSKLPGDQAQNVPDLLKEGSTCVSPDNHIVVVAHHHNSAAMMLITTEKVSLDNTYNYKNAFIVVVVLAGTIIFALLVLLYFSLRKRCNKQRSEEDPLNDNKLNTTRSSDDDRYRREIQHERQETGTQCVTTTQDAGTQCQQDATIIVSPGTSGRCAQVVDEESEVLTSPTVATEFTERIHEQRRHQASLQHLHNSRSVSETQNNIIALEESGASSPDQNEPCIDLVGERRANGTIAETVPVSISENPQQRPVQSTSEQQQQLATSDFWQSSLKPNTATEQGAEDELDSEASENDYFIGS